MLQHAGENSRAPGVRQGAHLNTALPRRRVREQRRYPPLLLCCRRPLAARLSWLLPLARRVPLLLLLPALVLRAARGRAGRLQRQRKVAGLSGLQRAPAPRSHNLSRHTGGPHTAQRDTHLPPPKPALHVFHSPAPRS